MTSLAKYLGSARNKGAENIGLDENRGIGKECRYKTMEHREFVRMNYEMYRFVF